MMKKFYKIGKLSVCLESDIAFEESEATMPFISAAQEDAINISFKATDVMEIPSNEPIYKSSSVTIYKSENCYYRVFILPATNKPASVTIKTENGYICTYDRAYAKYFSKSVNMLNAIGLERLAFERDMFYLHCSFIDLNGEAILFSGESTAGKSTRAMMFEKYADAKIINHDKALLYFENGELYACGSPISGSSNIVLNESRRVAAVVFLGKSVDNNTVSLRPHEAISKMIKNTIFNTWDKEFSAAAYSFVLDFVSKINVYYSECNLNPDSVCEQRKVMKL